MTQLNTRRRVLVPAPLAALLTWAAASGLLSVAGLPANAAPRAGPGTIRQLTPELKALLPKGATNVRGDWVSTQTLVHGKIEADIVGSHACEEASSTGGISIEFSAHPMLSERIAKTLRQADDQWLEEQATGMEELAKNPEAADPPAAGIGPAKREQVGIGRMVYQERKRVCVQTQAPGRTETELIGLARTGKLTWKISVNVPSTAAETRALGAEVLGKLVKSGFPVTVK